MISNKWFFGTENKDLMNESIAIRTAVFEKEQGKGPEELDQFDIAAYHLNVYDNGKPVATGRVYFTAGDYYIGKLAVSADSRGKKTGDFLIRLLIVKALNQGAFTIKVNADKNAAGFYAKYGFVQIGDSFDINGVEHIPMALERENVKLCTCKG